MAQDAATANGPTASSVPTVGGLIDTKAYGKPKSFDGKEEQWSTWSFVARSYFTLLSPDFASLIELAENQPSGTMRMHVLSEPAQVHARTLYHILAQSVDGKALSVMMNVERQNGFEAWKALVDTYQPDLGGRHTSMLIGIISPSWEAVTEGDFLEALENWEVLVRSPKDQRQHHGRRLRQGQEVYQRLASERRLLQQHGGGRGPGHGTPRSSPYGCWRDRL